MLTIPLCENNPVSTQTLVRFVQLPSRYLYLDIPPQNWSGFCLLFNLILYSSILCLLFHLHWLAFKFLKHTKFFPTARSLHLLFLLPGSLFPLFLHVYLLLILRSPFPFNLLSQTSHDYTIYLNTTLLFSIIISSCFFHSTYNLWLFVIYLLTCAVFICL